MRLPHMTNLLFSLRLVMASPSSSSSSRCWILFLLVWSIVAQCETDAVVANSATTTVAFVPATTQTTKTVTTTTRRMVERLPFAPQNLRQSSPSATLWITKAFAFGKRCKRHGCNVVVSMSAQDDDEDVGEETTTESPGVASEEAPPTYDLGVGKNLPLSELKKKNMTDGASATTTTTTTSSSAKQDKGSGVDLASDIGKHWATLNPVTKTPPVKSNATTATMSAAAGGEKKNSTRTYKLGIGKNLPVGLRPEEQEEATLLKKAIWDDAHYDRSGKKPTNVDFRSTLANQQAAGVTEASQDGAATNMPPNVETPTTTTTERLTDAVNNTKPFLRYEDIDLSIPDSVYSVGNGDIDVVWDMMRREAKREAEREPLLVSFLHSTILNHPSLESALAFHLANKLSSPAMISTQIMALIREALEGSSVFRRSLRADIMAVRDRDPACTCLPDVFLYFKGFHALQTHRVAHYLWTSGRRVLAHYLQGQVSQNFQIDIHPNATLGSGIMLDHGTGIVIGETATVGHNCSILHHVTLGGSGKKGIDRHPKIGNGVLLGAGASILGSVRVGDSCQIGAGTLVIADLPPRSVAVGVPAKIIGSFVDERSQPSIGMNQLGTKESDDSIVTFETDNI